MSISAHAQANLKRNLKFVGLQSYIGTQDRICSLLKGLPGRGQVALAVG